MVTLKQRLFFQFSSPFLSPQKAIKTLISLPHRDLFPGRKEIADDDKSLNQHKMQKLRNRNSEIKENNTVHVRLGLNIIKK